MKSFYERFSYVIPCISIGLDDKKNHKYKVLPTISLFDSLNVRNLPLCKSSANSSMVYNDGVLHLYEVVNFILLRIYSPNQYTFDSLALDLLHMPFGFENFDYRLLPHESGNRFDIIVTPVSIVEDIPEDDDETLPEYD